MYLNTCNLKKASSDELYYSAKQNERRMLLLQPTTVGNSLLDNQIYTADDHINGQ